MKHSHYFKDVSHLKLIDVYRVIELWEVKDPCIQHALKKLLVAGKRGAKDEAKDIQEAIDTLERWKAMRKEESEQEQQPATAGEKPSWDDAPEWARWVAQDEDGEWWWHSEKPEPLKRQWSVYARVDLASKGDGQQPNPNWATTLQQRPNNDGWIEWHGGECPVSQGSVVEVKFRNPTLTITSCAQRSLSWQHHGTDGDIIAYRIVKEQS